MNRIETKSEDQGETNLVDGVILPRSNPIWMPDAIFKKWTWHHNSTEGSSILMKFGRPMQN